MESLEWSQIQMLACLVYSQKYITLFKSIEKKFFNEIIIFLLLACTYINLAVITKFAKISNRSSYSW